MDYDPYSFTKQAFPMMYALIESFGDGGRATSTVKKNMNTFVLGAAFTVSF